MKKSYPKFSQVISTVGKKTFLSIVVSITVFSLSLTPALASPIDQDSVLQLINVERVSRNLKPLSIDSDLNQAATMKSKDMINRDYFEHYAFGLTPWDFIKNSGYDYLYAGENLAMDFVTSEGMVKAWMNSPQHRDNILNPNFDEIGIGIVKGEYTENSTNRESTIVTNMFGQKKPIVLKYLNDFITRFLRFF